MLADRTHVFYADSYNGWAVALLDKDEFQIGEAEYTYRKSDAVELAKQYGVDAHIFGRDGLYQRTIKASAPTINGGFAEDILGDEAPIIQLQDQPTGETNMQSFTHKETGKTFYYERLPINGPGEEAVLAPPPHGGKDMVYGQRIFVGDGEYGQGWRYGVVLTTVAYVIVDEKEEDGRHWWITESWPIRRNN